MRAAVLEGIDLTVMATCHDDGRITGIGCDVVANFRDFRFEAEIIPNPSSEQALLFSHIDVLALKYPIGHATKPISLPFQRNRNRV